MLIQVKVHLEGSASENATMGMLHNLWTDDEKERRSLQLQQRYEYEHGYCARVVRTPDDRRP